jgi:hypothetical protein
MTDSVLRTTVPLTSPVSVFAERFEGICIDLLEVQGTDTNS